MKPVQRDPNLQPATQQGVGQHKGDWMVFGDWIEILSRFGLMLVVVGDAKRGCGKYASYLVASIPRDEDG